MPANHYFYQTILKQYWISPMVYIDSLREGHIVLHNDRYFTMLSVRYIPIPVQV